MSETEPRTLKPRPWQHPSGQVLSNTTVDGFQYWGEVGTILKVLLLIVALAVMILIGRWFEAREKRKKQQQRQSGMINDRDEAAGPTVEMTELNPAAEAAAAEAAAAGTSAEGAVGVSVDEPWREGMDGVRDELERLRMSQYAAAFESHGYDVWGEILRLPPHRLAKLIELVGMSANHSDRFKEALVTQRRRLKILQVLPMAGGDDSCVIL